MTQQLEYARPVWDDLTWVMEGSPTGPMVVECATRAVLWRSAKRASGLWMWMWLVGIVAFWGSRAVARTWKGAWWAETGGLIGIGLGVAACGVGLVGGWLSGGQEFEPGEGIAGGFEMGRQGLQGWVKVRARAEGERGAYLGRVRQRDLNFRLKRSYFWEARTAAGERYVLERMPGKAKVVGVAYEVRAGKGTEALARIYREPTAGLTMLGGRPPFDARLLAAVMVYVMLSGERDGGVL